VLRPERNAWRVLGPARLRGDLAPPGDKSVAHRAVLLAALSSGACELRDLPTGDDVRRTLEAVAALGVRVEPMSHGVRVHGVGLRGLHPSRAPLDCGNSGTTMRLLAGILAAQPFASVLVGDASLSRRPMRRVASPLRAMGGRVECLGAGDRPPLRIQGPSRGPLQGGECVLEVDSAQVRSCVLLAALHASGPTRVVPAGASRDHTERLLRALGVRLERAGDALVLYPTLPSSGLQGFDLRVPGDLSSAAFFVAMAAATPGASLRVSRVGLNPSRARYLDILRAAGARLRVVPGGEERGEPWGEVQVEGGSLRSLHLAGDDVVQCLDEVPALVVAAAAAGCEAEVRDATELRVKESDRIAGLARLLEAFGASVLERRDGLTLRAGSRLRPARVASGGDHRLAMAAALLATRVAGESRVEDVACVATSYPGFATDLVRLARTRVGPSVARARRV
jgi:3-phosphoshikimate 1-carboxyvinyltransferase